MAVTPAVPWSVRTAIGLAGAEVIRLLPARASGPAVLVLRLDAIGDQLLWLSSGIQAISDYCRSLGRSVLLTRIECADLHRGLGLFDEVLAIDVGRFLRDSGYSFGVLFRLRRMGFRTLIQVRASREHLLEDAIVRATRTSIAVGNAGDTSNLPRWVKRCSDRWYTRLIDVPDTLQHALVRDAAFARALTGVEPRALRIALPEGVTDRLGIGNDYFVMAPGAGTPSRQWPADRFASLGRRIADATAWRCVVTGAPGERPLAQQVCDRIGERAVNLAGRITLAEMGSVLAKARLAVTNESGGAHYAPLVGTKAVVILGGGHFGRFLPYPEAWPEASRPIPVYQRMDCYGCNWICRFATPADGPVPCVDRVSADDVWAAVRPLLEDRSPKASNANPVQNAAGN